MGALTLAFSSYLQESSMLATYLLIVAVVAHGATAWVSKEQLEMLEKADPALVKDCIIDGKAVKINDSARTKNGQCCECNPGRTLGCSKWTKEAGENCENFSKK